MMEQIVKYNYCTSFPPPPNSNTLLKTKYYFTQKGTKVINIT